MSRRILLIDSDPAFRQILASHLAAYKLEVQVEADADDAIAAGTSNPPAAVVVAVDEPEKNGFKIFQRLKKGPLASVPVVLVTSSVTPESFAKHRQLKVHADEYLDKRTLKKDELLGKLDNLIGLGEVVEDDEIPVEVDDIALDDGDMVMEEVMTDDVVEEDNVSAVMASIPRSRSVTAAPPPASAMESQVAAETDAAFDALLGGLDDAPSIEAVSSSPRGVPMMSSMSDEETQFSAPIPIHEDELAVEAPSSPAAMVEDVQDVPVSSDSIDVADFEDAPVSAVGATPAPAPAPAPAIGSISLDDLAVAAESASAPELELPDDALKAYEPPASMIGITLPPVEEPTPAPAPAPNAPGAGRDAKATAMAAFESSPAIMLDQDDLQSVEDDSGVPEPVHHARSAQDAEDAAEQAKAREKSRPRFLDSPTVIGLVPEAPLKRAPVPTPAPASTPPAPAARTSAPLPRLAPQRPPTVPPVVLDEPPARPTPPPPPAEPAMVVAPVPADEPAPTVEVEAPEPKLGVASIVDLGLEEVAQRAESEQSGVYDRRSLRKIDELERQLAQTKSELEKARSAAEGQKSSGGGREREFLNLREQVITRDKELARTKADMAARERDAAAAEAKAAEAVASRAALEQKLADAEARAAAEHTKLATAESKERVLASQLETVQQELDARGQAVAAAETARQQLERELATDRANRAATTSDAERAWRVEREQLVQKSATDATALKTQHESALATLRKELDERRETTIEALREELASQQAAAVEAAVLAARTELGAEAESAVNQLESQHATDLAQLREEHAAAVAKSTTAHATELRAVREELDTRSVASAGAHDKALAELREELAAVMTAHETARAGEAAAHAAALEALRKELADERSARAADAERAATAAKDAAEQAATAATQAAERAAAEAQTAAAAHREAVAQLGRSHEQAVAQLTGTHEQALSQHRGDLDRALATARTEHEKTLASARSEHDKTTADLRTTHEKARADHDRALADLRAQHEKALATLAAEHERSRGDLGNERDELAKGLSAQRDTGKRLEGELASAVQTIADRNSELRTHTAAVAERDQRLTELRGELTALEAENANYQEQVLRAYQKIKADEAMVARAKKAMAIALTVLDEPTSKSD